MKINVVLERVTLRMITCLYFLFFLELLKNKNNKMFCAFIDFEKAFYKAWRDALCYKLLLNNMNDGMYNIIVNMYSGTHSRMMIVSQHLFHVAMAYIK